MRLTRVLASLILGFLLVSGALARGEENWPMYGRDLRHTFSNRDSLINAGNVATLKPAWDFPTGDVVSASPSVADGVVYVGSWDGNFYALDARAGTPIWTFAIDCQNSVVPVPPRCLSPGQTPPARFLSDGGLITSSAAIVHGVAYFAGGKTVYAVNANDGSLRWKRVICGNPDSPDCASDPNDPNRIFSSPAVFDGLIFIGHTVDGAVGYRGGIEALEAASGKTRWHFEVDPSFDQAGNVIGGQNRGCGDVWSSAAVDVRHRLVFFGTADCNNEATPPYHNAVLALRADTGELVWAYRPIRPDDACDFDFGASANLIDGWDPYVGIGGKDGTYYLLARLTEDPQGQLIWSQNVVFGGDEGGFIGSTAFDGTQVFGATAIGDGHIVTGTGLCDPSNPRDTVLQEPSMHAFDLFSPSPAWQATGNHSVAPTTVADGVVFSGLAGIEPFAVNAYDAGSGALLASFPMPGSVDSGATPVGGMLFVGSGTTTDGSGSGVHALTLPGDWPGT